MEARDFFSMLEDGGKYISLIMDIDVYNADKSFYDQNCVEGSIRIKDSSLDDDEVRNQLIKDISKAKKKLRDYEFNRKYNIR